MKRFASVAMVCVVGLGAAIPAFAQDAPARPADAADEATHEQLRALRDGVTEAFNKLGTGNHPDELPKLLTYLHKDFVLAAMNGEVSIGPAGVQDYYERKLGGANATVQTIHHTFSPAALTTIYGGDTGVSYGTTLGKYVLTDGMVFEVETNYTATLVKENGKWLLASFQFAPSIFENPVVDAAVGWIYKAGGLGALLGLLLGLFGGVMLGKKKSAA